MKTHKDPTMKCNPKKTKNINLLPLAGSHTRDTCHKIETRVIKSLYGLIKCLVRSNYVSPTYDTCEIRVRYVL
jgi:hypothetical protein